MTTSTIISMIALSGLRDRILADAGDDDRSGLEALTALTDPELAAYYYGYAQASREPDGRGDLHARAASHALAAAGALDSITPEIRRQVRAELAITLG